MFFQKKTPPIESHIESPVKPIVEYSATMEADREICPVFIDLSALPFKILSVERADMNTPNEETVVFCVKEDGEIEEYPFKISRKQHKELIGELEASSIQSRLAKSKEL
jgi:hypothetical protein